MVCFHQTVHEDLVCCIAGTLACFSPTRKMSGPIEILGFTEKLIEIGLNH